jgi:hypothetical protein
MSAAVDLLLSRLDKPRASGKDRWRCACPACGGGNRSTLSIGVGDNGCVLLTCWKSGCSPEEIAAAIGLTIEDLFPPCEASASPLLRRRMLPAAQALELLESEMTLAVVVMSDLRRGIVPDDETSGRFLLALARVIEIRDEASA